MTHPEDRPRYDEMLCALVGSAALKEGEALRALDIGCGTGAASSLLLKAHPKIELTCLDMTESMLDLARRRLADQDARFVLADVHDFEPDGPYDAVISSLALHHVVTDADKRTLYRKIFSALAQAALSTTRTSCLVPTIPSRRYT